MNVSLLPGGGSQAEGNGPPRREAGVWRLTHGVQAARHLLRELSAGWGEEKLPAVRSRCRRARQGERHAPRLGGNGRDFDCRAEEPRVFAVDLKGQTLFGGTHVRDMVRVPPSVPSREVGYRASLLLCKRQTRRSKRSNGKNQSLHCLFSHYLCLLKSFQSVPCTSDYPAVKRSSSDTSDWMRDEYSFRTSPLEVIIVRWIDFRVFVTSRNTPTFRWHSPDRVSGS